MADKWYEDSGDVDESVGTNQASQGEEVTDLGHLTGKPVPPTNDMALVSFLSGVGGWILGAFGICPLLQGLNLCLVPLAFLAWAGALYSGFIARGQLMESEEGGKDLAVWGMASGGAGIVLGTLLVLIVAVLFLVLGVNLRGM